MTLDMKRVFSTEVEDWSKQKHVRERLKFLDAHRRSGENWICVELGLYLESSGSWSQIKVEEPYAHPYSRKRCDIVIEKDAANLWVEVAHIWQWHQAKGRFKCKEDLARATRGIPSAGTHSGMLLIFLVSRPRWFDERFEQWVQERQREGQVLLVNLDLS